MTVGYLVKSSHSCYKRKSLKANIPAIKQARKITRSSTIDQTALFPKPDNTFCSSQSSSSTVNPNLPSMSPRSPLHGNLASLESTKSRISLLGSRYCLASQPTGAA